MIKYKNNITWNGSVKNKESLRIKQIKLNNLEKLIKLLDHQSE